jgi:hypothetical protein
VERRTVRARSNRPRCDGFDVCERSERRAETASRARAGAKRRITSFFGGPRPRECVRAAGDEAGRARWRAQAGDGRAVVARDARCRCIRGRSREAGCCARMSCASAACAHRVPARADRAAVHACRRVWTLARDRGRCAIRTRGVARDLSHSHRSTHVNRAEPLDPFDRDVRAARGDLSTDDLLVLSPPEIITGERVAERAMLVPGRTAMIMNGDLDNHSNNPKGDSIVGLEPYADEHGRPRIRVLSRKELTFADAVLPEALVRERAPKFDRSSQPRHRAVGVPRAIRDVPDPVAPPSTNATRQRLPSRSPSSSERARRHIGPATMGRDDPSAEVDMRGPVATSPAPLSRSVPVESRRNSTRTISDRARFSLQDPRNEHPLAIALPTRGVRRLRRLQPAFDQRRCRDGCGQ